MIITDFPARYAEMITRVSLDLGGLRAAALVGHPGAGLGVLLAPGLLPACGRAGTMAVRWIFRDRAVGRAGGCGRSAHQAR
ncbi:MAG TPA: hypothetical protein DHU96_21215 [Actinobacteria bacterium]|nr:hypothetical protein [Actinomycetota bacterium]